jgi:formylglycine-generating enzyme required for sulfatase activity
MDAAVIQLLSETLFSPVSSVLTGVLGNWLFAKVLVPETEKSCLLGEFDKAFNQAVTRQDSDFHELVKDLSKHLNRNPQFAGLIEKQFTACLMGLDRFREPSAETLWSMYRQAAEETVGGLLEKRRFHLAISALWYVFLGALEDFPKLRRLLLDQYEAATGEEQVGCYEAHKLMKVYCRVRLAECERQLRSYYRLNQPPEWLADAENIEQFCTYRPIPPMLWEMRDGRIVEEQPVDEVFLLPSRLVIYTGIGGVGKTRFFEEFERIELAKQAVSPYPDYLPIRLTAEEIGREGSDVAAAVTAKIENSLRNASLADYPPESIKYKARALAEYLRVRKGALLLLVDGFDQVAIAKEQTIVDSLILGSSYGLTSCAIATRPCRKDSLCAKTVGMSDDFAVIRIEPFSEEMIEDYFGPYYKKVERLTKELKKQDVSSRLEEDRHQGYREAHFLQIPLLARYLKEMTIHGQVEGIDNKAKLVERFVEHVEGQQADKFNLSDDDCRSVFRRLGELALHLLAKEQGMARIEIKEKRIDDYLRDTPMPLEKMERFGLLRPLLDPENHPVFRFQHQLLQEFLAARCLYQQYSRKKLWQQGRNTKKFFNRIEAINYGPDEVAGFLAQLIATGRLAPIEELEFWHEQVVMNPKLDSDWVRTYGLQIRDAIADENKEAAAVLAELFSREQVAIEKYLAMVKIPAGVFVFGSYEDEDERPVLLLKRTKTFLIDRFPVTNLQFCEFLWTRFPGIAEPKDECGKEIIHFESSRIAKARSGYVVEKGYNRHPVVGVTWYGARAYCIWRSEKEGLLDQPYYRLPTETEWEHASRGQFGRRYPWGNDFATDRCNTRESEKNETSTVGDYLGKGDSPYGCCDMAGNVWEWPDSHYRDYLFRVMLGGSCLDDRAAARCAYRRGSLGFTRLGIIGFRCARTIKNE